MKIILPKTHLSKSQKYLWENSKSQYRKRYYENQKLFVTKEMNFGTEFEANLLQTQTEIKVDCDGVTLFGIMDFFSEGKKEVRDDKTGKKEWTQERVENSEDLKFYSLAVYLKYGWIPKFKLDWYETAEENGEIVYTGRKESFGAQMTKEEVLAYKEEILAVAKEISEDYIRWQEQSKEKVNTSLFDQYSDLLQQKADLDEKISETKALISEDLKMNGVRDFKTENISCYYQSGRKKWTYSKKLTEQEKALKEAKKTEEKDGTATCTSGEEILVIKSL